MFDTPQTVIETQNLRSYFSEELARASEDAILCAPRTGSLRHEAPARRPVPWTFQSSAPDRDRARPAAEGSPKRHEYAP